MQYLPLVNTALIAIFVAFVGYKVWDISDSVIGYTDSAKEVNEAMVIQINGLGENLTDNINTQFTGLKTSIFDPIKTGVITPLSEASNNIKSLAELLGKKSLLLQERADSNERFAHVVLDQLKATEAFIYADEHKGNREPAELWAKRAYVEVEVIKWLAWNEKDVLYRLSVKDTGIDVDLFGGAHLRRWMIKGSDFDQELYDWFIENESISKELERLRNTKN